MKFISLIYEQHGGLESLSKQEHDGFIEQHIKLQAESRDRGVYLGAVELKPPTTARSVQMKKSEALVSDGPYAETKEYFIGLYLFDCESLNEALELASRIPTASGGGVEVRPLDEGTDCVNTGTDIDSLTIEGKRLFALLIYHPESLLEFYTDSDMEALIASNARMTEAATDNQEYIGSAKLMLPATATSLKGNNNHREYTDGPFCEAKEVLLGFHILACRSFDNALDYARMLNDVSAGIVEVRPVNYFDRYTNPEFEWSSKD